MRKPTQTPDIISAIRSRDLFGKLPAFRDLSTWRSWLVWLKAVFCLPMDAEDLALFRDCTGGRDLPEHEPSEVYTIVGRRGGKSFIAAVVTAFLATCVDFSRYLTTGETGVVLVLARDKIQARTVFRYCRGILRAIPLFAGMIEVERVDEIELTNGITIAIRTSDYRHVRGVTLCAAILDELAFWPSEGVNVDAEVLRSLRPAMSTIPTAKLIAISTPYGKAGAVWEAYREHFGQASEILVWQADSLRMNPTLSKAKIQKELERDPEAASSEYMARFREDLEQAFSPELIEGCVIPGRIELPASSELSYRAFADVSGGRRDAFTVAIGHLGGTGASVVDCLRAWPAPFNPSAIVVECAEVLKRYSVSELTADRYGGEWPVSEFAKWGIVYRTAEKVKSDLYLGLIPQLAAKKVELPDNKKLVRELQGLERRRGRSGKDSIDHRPYGSDDVANSVAGLVDLLTGEGGIIGEAATWFDRPPEDNPFLIDSGGGHGQALVDYVDAVQGGGGISSKYDW